MGGKSKFDEKNPFSFFRLQAAGDGRSGVENSVTSNDIDQYVLEKLFQDIQALRIQNYNLKPK